MSTEPADTPPADGDPAPAGPDPVLQGPDPRTATPARIRRAPRFGSFITTGLLLGLLVAVVVGLVRGADSVWAFVFVAATLMLVGGVAGAAVAVVADRRSR